MSLHTFIRQMPKVELHIHLEGSIRPATLLTLAERNGIPLPVTDLDAMRSFYRFTDFDRFLQIYFTISGCLKTVADFELIAYELGSSMVRQQILYAEVTFTPYTNVVNTSLSFEEIMEGLSEGRLRARAEFGVEMCWILDIVRDQPDTRHQVVEWAISAQDQGVIGLGLGGTERDHPPEWFADVYARAREAGLHSVPHAGEVAGPASVWKAIALWRAGGNHHLAWFICIFIFNTAGILPIIYIFGFSKKRD